MTRCCRIAAYFMLLAIVASVIGCGGGGGGTTPPEPPDANFVITGLVKDRDTNAPVVGAVVRIAGKSATTDTKGSYRLTYDTKPVASTWSVDGTSATPAPGYYIFWAQMGIVTDIFDAEALPMIDITSSSTTMPTVYLKNMETNIPPI